MINNFNLTLLSSLDLAGVNLSIRQSPSLLLMVMKPRFYSFTFWHQSLATVWDIYRCAFNLSNEHSTVAVLVTYQSIQTFFTHL